MIRYSGLILITMVVFLVGCTPPPQVTPVASSYVYTPPQEPRQALPITVALVRPTYADPAFMAQQVQWAQRAGNGFVGSMKSDMEKILVAKGLKVTGPYDSLEIMTFPQKRDADLTLTPLVDIRGDAKITNRTGLGHALSPFQEDGVLILSGWVSLVMLEPLTSEKMWVKRVEVAPIQEPFQRQSYQVRRGNVVETRVVSDTQEQALTKGLNRIYPEVMQKSWDYFHPEEVMLIKQQAADVRKLKRY